MAVPGRRGSVPTDLIIAARDAPLPWGSGLGTLRVPSRKLRLNPPGFEPPGSDMFVGTRMDEWDRQLAAPPRQLATRPRVKSAYEYMSAWPYLPLPEVTCRHSCSHMFMFEVSGCSVLIPAPVIRRNFYIEFCK